MRIKGRLKKIYDFLDEKEAHYYDLFCDHGILGAKLLEEERNRVTFNDKRDHLLVPIRREFGSNPSAEFVVGDARELKFEKNASILMAGVGGLTMISCFESWLSAMSREVLCSLEFVISPHYYGFELRRFLLRNGFQYGARSLVKDGRYIYEMAKVRMTGTPEELFLDQNYWRQTGEIGRDYLSYTLKNFSNKETLSDWESRLIEDIEKVISPT